MATSDSHPKTGDTIAVPRNFSADPAARMRAAIAGPPAYLLRRRRMEDLEAWIVNAVRGHQQRTGVVLTASTLPPDIARSFSALQRLVDAHNRYYPVEAQLPIDLSTGAPLDGGRRWEPKPAPDIQLFLALAASG